jgi:GR25 family glycosyltransferase involved in LPS biosynthesis
MKNIIALTVSTNYDDLLDIILPQNYGFFKRWYIVTDVNDYKTIDVVKKYNFENIELVYFNFYENSTFNKGGAIEYVQNMIENGGYSDFLMLFLDSDIYLPNNFSDIIDNLDLNDNTLYGPLIRDDFYSMKNFLDNNVDNHIVEQMSMGWVSGYFQLYKYNPIYKYNNSNNCSWCDVQFSKLFTNRVFINDLSVKHLGKAGINWDGRTDKNDFLISSDIELSKNVTGKIPSHPVNNNYKIKYYLIHGIDKSRKDRMINEFKNANIDNDNVKWILHPNKDELSDELKNNISIQNSDQGIFLTDGCISCTYKHFLALQDIVHNNYDYAVIFEDNIFFKDDAEKRIHLYIKQLNTFYPDWDVLFDSNFRDYDEQELIPGVFVYPKETSIDGGTRYAQCYLITNKCAKKYYDNYLPFNNPPDHFMNYLNKKLNINVFWSQPPLTNTFPHKSTI